MSLVGWHPPGEPTLTFLSALKEFVMPKTYTAVAGDTLESVSTLFYGTDSKAELIGVASGVTELQPGQILLIP